MDNVFLTKESIEELSKLAGYTTPGAQQAVMFGIGLAMGTVCGSMINALAQAHLADEEERANRHHNPSMHVVENGESES